MLFRPENQSIIAIIGYFANDKINFVGVGNSTINLLIFCYIRFMY